mgnify:CR=1 FL=1
MNQYSFKNINFIWISLLLTMLLLTIVNGGISDYDTTGFIAITLHAVFTFVLLTILPVKGAGILAGAFIARFIFMLWDLYASDIFLLPNSGGDSLHYYKLAVLFSEDLSYLSERNIGLYSKFLGWIFYFTGPMRILGQYINVLLGVSTVVIIYRIMLQCKINRRIIQVILVIAAFFPNSVIMSAILLREILPTFFIAFSLLWFVKWYLNQSFISFLLSIVMLGLASMFHSGVIVVALGYLFMYLFYSDRSNKFEISIKNVLMFIPIAAFIFLFTTQFGDALFFKFGKLEESGNIYGSVKSAAGGSAYLEGMTINSPLQFLLYAPIRAFYFLFSPLPMNWRGFADIITFMTDSLFYFFVLYFYYKNRRWFFNNKKLIFILLITLLIVAIVFGIGVSNSGTAMRHRQKIIPVALIFLAVMKNEKYKALTVFNKKNDEN